MTPPFQATQSLNISRDASAPKASKGDASEASMVAQIFIFKGVNFIGQDCFAQERISLGSGEHADLVLQGEGIADIQAYVYLKEGQIIISDRTANGVRINGIFQKTAMVRALDLVDIGPYTLKIKSVTGDTAASPQKTFHAAASIGQKPIAANRSVIKQAPTVAPPLPSEAKPTHEASFEAAKEEAVSESFGGESSDDFADFFQFYADPATANYDIVFYGQLRPAANPETVRLGLQRLFRAGPQQVESLFRQPRVVIKKNLSYQKAQQLKTVFEKTGAQCHLEPVDEQRLKANEFEKISTAEVVPSPLPVATTTPPPVEAAQPPSPSGFLTPDDLSSEIDTGRVFEKSPDEPATIVPASINEPEPLLEEVVEPEETSAPQSTDESLLNAEPTPEPALPEKPFATIDEDEEEEDDEPDCEADFQLRDKLVAARVASPATGDTQIQVIKLRNDQVLDISYLKKRQRYTIDYKGRKFCLAENRRNNAALFYFSDHLSGRIESAGEGVVSTNRLMRDLKPWRRRKNLFRRELPNDGCVLLHDGDFEYRLTVCDVAPPADVQLPPKEKRHPYKHAATSFLFHVVFIAFLGLMPSFNADDNNELETHFVQLDQEQFAELSKLTKPKPKPKKPTPPPPPPKKVEPPPQPPVKKTAPVTKVKPNRVASGKKKKSSKVASVSRHPNAGGGFGKGNVVNRNVNQAGLLSMLGDSVGFQPQAAVAAVTNLDAVTAVGGVGKSNFKVGGIVGKLGSDKISVPTGGIVATRGSKQVLRSIGASGPGKVAALEKGEIGHKQVGGTVTASLTKSVLIQGGMSRQAVKRVIDQHLDEITYCYETALISNPSIMGKMIFEWRILTSGEVGEVRIKSSTVNSHEIHACIKAAIKTWQFPKPKGSTVVVSYPFIFDVVGF